MHVEPGWLSLLPPLVAIVLALAFREVVLSLFAGVWFGALIVANWNPLVASMISVDRFIVEGLADTDKISIVVFSMLLGGMVGVIGRSGGTLGLVESMRGLATSARRGQVMGWLAGIIIFFDDYANTLIVGNTMRPVTDRLNISREKLAYIVDSTAAPIAAIAIISTWVGFEISLIGDALRTAASQTADPAAAAQLLQGAANPFNVFLHSIPYLFYPILTLAFVLMVALTGRDFGPMREAERRARSGGGVSAPGARPAVDVTGGYMSPPEGTPHRWYNAAVPVLTVIVVALLGIVYTGSQAAPDGATLWGIVGGADPFKTLIWASFAGNIVAITMAVTQRLLPLAEALEAWLNGMRAMLLAIIILVLAWALGGVTEALGTGPYLSGVLQDSLPLGLLPVIVFVTAAATSFATGTSWGTMAILFPVTIPLAVAMGAGVDFAGGAQYSILLGVISSVMAGSIFGDHCSPISDTTVMSSMASACDHIDHVRTQMPYAITVAIVGMLVGDIPTAYGVPTWVSLVAGLVILYLLLRFLGKPIDEGNVASAAEDRAAALVS